MVLKGVILVQLLSQLSISKIKRLIYFYSTH